MTLETVAALTDDPILGLPAMAFGVQSKLN
jgi:hypothetical protein